MQTKEEFLKKIEDIPERELRSYIRDHILQLVKNTQKLGELNPFKIERFFAKYEFTIKYLLCCSDCESLTQKEVISLADQECKDLWDNLALSYTDSKAHPLISEELVKYYNKSKINSLEQNKNIDIQQIEQKNIIEVVPEEGIYISMLSMLKPGDHVVAVAPAYQSLIEVAKSIGCKLSYWELQENFICNITTKNGQQLAKYEPKFDIETLQSIVTPQTKLVVTNFPHNPSGYIPTQQEYMQIVDICKKSDAYLFSDEMYRGLQYDSKSQLLSGCQVYDKAICLSGMSKTYSMPGLRFGWLATRDEQLMASLMHYKDYTTICQSAPSQILALIGLRNHEKLEKQNQEIINSGISRVQELCAKHSDKLIYIHSIGGSCGFLKFTENFTKSTKYASDLAQKNGILILPGSEFDYYADDQHFRIGYGRKNVIEVIDLWDQILSSQ